MIALFSPSEGKRSGGTGAFLDVQASLLGGPSIRTELIAEYERILLIGSDAEKRELTGWKDLEKIAALPRALAKAPTLSALDRYTGVGYQYLDVEALSVQERAFLESRLVIFSNLLGPLRGGELIPETKCKQRRRLAGVDIAKHYKEHLSAMIDELIGDEPVLDLRASAYGAYYQPKTPVVTCEFLKAGKKVNHWSKACRGLVLRAFAQHRPATREDVARMTVPGLTLLDVEPGAVQTLTYQAE